MGKYDLSRKLLLDNVLCSVLNAQLKKLTSHFLYPHPSPCEMALALAAQDFTGRAPLSFFRLIFPLWCTPSFGGEGKCLRTDVYPSLVTLRCS